MKRLKQRLKPKHSSKVGQRTASKKATPATLTIDPEIEILGPEQGDSPTKLPAKLPSPSSSTTTAGSLVPYDPLQAYLREIRRYPRLTKEQEQALAVQYQEHNDVHAAYQLVSSNLWLVVKIAREYRQAARNFLDLIQEGNMGLMEAVKNFDPYRGVRFPSYAVWWIRAYIVRFLIANWRLVKIGTTQAQRKLFFNLKKEKERLEREGLYPAPKLLAEKLDVKEQEIVEMEQRLESADVSFDAPLQSDSGANLLSILPSQDSTAEDLVAAKQFHQLVQQNILEFTKSLNEKEQLILEKRLLSETKATLRELAEELSLSRERIRQLEQRIKEKLKLFLIEKYGKDFSPMEH